MKTDYKILWVDDEIASIEEDREEIQDFLARRGIKTHFRMIQSDGTSRIHDNIKEGLNDPQLDLIVVDYRMASEGDPDPMDGERLINMIRQSDHVYLPVVFYSSHYNDLLKAVAEAHLDGVYLAQRDRVRQKLELVITSLLRKEETSKHTRGLLMEGVSQIDASLGDLLMSVWGRLDAAGKATLHTYFKAKVEENLQTCIERKEKYPDLEGFEDYMREKFVSPEFDTMVRFKVLKKGLSLVKAAQDLQKTFQHLFEYPGKFALVGLRNKYGHQTREKLAEIHTEELCIFIRNELRRQLDNCEALLGQ